MRRSVACVLVVALMLASVPRAAAAQESYTELKVRVLLIAGAIAGAVVGGIWLLKRAYKNEQTSNLSKLLRIATFDTPTMSFRLLPIGQAEVQTTVLTNVSTGSFTVHRAYVAGRGFSLESGPEMPITLSPGDQLTFRVRFAPERGCRCVGELKVLTDLREGDPTATLLGRAR